MAASPRARRSRAAARRRPTAGRRRRRSRRSTRRVAGPPRTRAGTAGRAARGHRGQQERPQVGESPSCADRTLDQRPAGRAASRNPRRGGAGSEARRRLPQQPLRDEPALMRHIGSPTPGIVPPPTCSRFATRADASPGRNIALCASVCSMPSAVPRHASRSRAVNWATTCRVTTRPRRSSMPAPRADLVEETGRRAARPRRARGCRALSSATRRRERHEQEQVLVAGRRGGRVGRGGARRVHGRDLGDAQVGGRGQPTGAEDVVEVPGPVAREEQRVVRLRQGPAHTGHDEQRGDAQTVPLPRRGGVVAVRGSSSAFSVWCRSAPETTTSASTKPPPAAARRARHQLRRGVHAGTRGTSSTSIATTSRRSGSRRPGARPGRSATPPSRCTCRQRCRCCTPSTRIR